MIIKKSSHRKWLIDLEMDDAAMCGVMMINEVCEGAGDHGNECGDNSIMDGWMEMKAAAAEAASAAAALDHSNRASIVERERM